MYKSLKMILKTVCIFGFLKVLLRNSCILSPPYFLRNNHFDFQICETTSKMFRCHYKVTQSFKMKIQTKCKKNLNFFVDISEVLTNQQITLECPFVPEYDVELNPLTEDTDLEADLEDETVPSRPPLVVDRDLELKVRRACERISENVHICANEPSLAFFRLSEHVRKALPPTVDSRQQVQHIQRQLGAAYENADLALQ